ncbi:MAG: aminoacyl-histidine dipeptidase [Bacteroidales bacterium]|nr:aminoacyl-histidine dipeptidase [Bacteroidales bacterium]
MNNALKNLKPELLWQIFEEICSIPHPSKYEGKISEYVLNFAKKHNIESFVDEVGNVILRKPATPDMENRKGVILQGHLDMVPQKNSDTKHDFLTDPILPYVDGEWVKAHGTTLGGDNGIGVAASLAIMASTNLVHGPIEALLTIDEETGMTGAFGLKSGVLKGSILMNLDSEDEGELYVGCAGGIDTTATLKYEEEKVPVNHIAFKLELKGLKGGHSGCDIQMGRGNSNKLLFRFLHHATRKHDLRLSAIDGGSLRNAIPRESFAVVTIPADNEQKFMECLKHYEGIYKSELSSTEPSLMFNAIKTDLPAFVFDKVSQDKLIQAVYGCPNGVIRMSADMENLVETSLNLAIVKSENKKTQVICLLRSSVDTAKEDLSYMVESVFRLAGAEVKHEGAYPGWKPNMNSAILKVCGEIYHKMYGKIPEIKAIHAGLECGLLGGVYPHWDMISFGPTIRSPHSPDERVEISTVVKFWDFLVEVLKNIPA